MRGRIVVLLIGALTLGWAATAKAQTTDYPPTPANCSINNGAAVSAGGLVPLNCIDLLASRVYSISFSQSPAVSLGSASTDAAGTLNRSIRIPSSAHAGAATITLRSGTDVHQFGITVSGAATSGGIGLPKTGQEIERYAIWGVVLILIGTALVTYTRRRRRKATVDASV
jgi:LPXTG-motif cell wall-anchored protein